MGFFNRFKTKIEQAVKESRPKSVSAKKAEPQDKTALKKEVAGDLVTKEDKLIKTAYRTLVRPLVSEKSAALAESGKYVFVVRPEATKLDIARAVVEVYGTRPVSVNLMNVRGKQVRFGNRFGKRKNWQKAIVTMPAGKTLPIYE